MNAVPVPAATDCNVGELPQHIHQSDDRADDADGGCESARDFKRPGVCFSLPFHLPQLGLERCLQFGAIAEHPSPLQAIAQERLLHLADSRLDREESFGTSYLGKTRRSLPSMLRDFRVSNEAVPSRFARRERGHARGVVIKVTPRRPTQHDQDSGGLKEIFNADSRAGDAGEYRSDRDEDASEQPKIDFSTRGLRRLQRAVQ